MTIVYNQALRAFHERSTRTDWAWSAAGADLAAEADKRVDEAEAPRPRKRRRRRPHFAKLVGGLLFMIGGAIFGILLWELDQWQQKNMHMYWHVSPATPPADRHVRF